MSTKERKQIKAANQPDMDNESIMALQLESSEVFMTYPWLTDVAQDKMSKVEELFEDDDDAKKILDSLSLWAQRNAERAINSNLTGTRSRPGLKTIRQLFHPPQQRKSDPLDVFRHKGTGKVEKQVVQPYVAVFTAFKVLDHKRSLDLHRRGEQVTDRFPGSARPQRRHEDIAFDTTVSTTFFVYGLALTMRKQFWKFSDLYTQNKDTVADLGVLTCV
ncbi:hypothetical protein NMY22_g9646 [Coprinellus aureogranulatus]|nr:hypothetical protein NMY22_g9646 [Coprinellus aureogranulatus]